MSAPNPTSDLSVTATHDAGPVPEAERCDLCDEPLGPDADEGCVIGGHGVFLSTRGDEVRRETVPLCPGCASAIGMSVFARSEIEEEEG